MSAKRKTRKSSRRRNPAERSAKRYRCTQCGHEQMQTTNHFGPTWSWEHSNTCPKCPPYKKYPEFGGQTIWECMEPQSETRAILQNGKRRTTPMSKKKNRRNQGKRVKAKVVFKKFKDGDVIALFPKLPFDRAGNITSYQHVGQHAAASKSLLRTLKNASRKEYLPLYRELTSRGYAPVVSRRGLRNPGKKAKALGAYRRKAANPPMSYITMALAGVGAYLLYKYVFKKS